MRQIVRQIVERAPVPAIRKGFITGGMGTIRRRPPMVAESEEAPEVMARRLAEDAALAGPKRDRAPGAEGLRVEGRRQHGRVPLPHSLFERQGREWRGSEVREAESVGGERIEVERRRRMEAERAGAGFGREVMRFLGARASDGRMRAAVVRRAVRGLERREVAEARRGEVVRRRWDRERVEELLTGEARRGGGLDAVGQEGRRARRRGRFEAEEELRLELVR